MFLLSTLLLSVCLLRQVQAKGVFAHYMVGNTANTTSKDWENDISAAKEAGIDAFALNMGAHDPANEPSLVKAFAAASKQDFGLFFSFDYSANGYWPQDDIIHLLQVYQTNNVYYKYKSKMVVSTFEGDGSAQDWNKIKNETDCFFIPDWSSISPKYAMQKGVADGLFNWEGWPNGPNNMTTDQDDDYKKYLDGKPYMMPVSPWFYTNMPGYHKNWVWRGDDLWYERWNQVQEINPEFVEIISWNDYGESHYIGPLRGDEYVSFKAGKAPFNYVENMPHDGWRAFLPYVIQQFKTGKAAVAQEGVVAWYRRTKAKACDSGSTTGNAVSEGQHEYPPGEILTDRIFYSALLNSTADVSVSIGSDNQTASWDSQPSGGKGIYHGSVAMGDKTGKVVVTISRDNKMVAQMNGETITEDCAHNKTNWNAWVGSGMAAKKVDVDGQGSDKKSFGVSVKTGLGDVVTLAGLVCVVFALL